MLAGMHALASLKGKNGISRLSSVEKKAGVTNSC